MSTLLKQGKSFSELQEEDTKVREIVSKVIQEIENEGDSAVRKYSEKFDHWSPDSFRLSEEQIEEIVSSVPSQTIEDIKFAQHQIRHFAEKQRASIHDIEVETLPGVTLGHKNIPVNSAGCYIPGGRYPMVASAHMSILTAKVAGVKRVIGFTPPIKGEIPSATIAAMYLAGADEIYLLGGVQAMAAMAVGTETIFLGSETNVAYGDKVIGTNHTLPTNKAAKYTGGLWVGKFLNMTSKNITS